MNSEKIKTNCTWIRYGADKPSTPTEAIRLLW